MDEFKGIIRITFNEKIIGFKFGTMQASLFCKEMNCKLADMEKLLDGTDIEAQLNWYYTAHVAYSRLFKESHISKDELAAIIDSYGQNNLDNEAMSAIISPKEEAQ